MVIDVHKGEANGSRLAFQRLAAEEKEALIKFLKSL